MRQTFTRICFVTVNGDFSLSSNATNVTAYIGSSTVNTGASNASHVIGSVNKVGNDAFLFPIGSGTKFTPVGISSPGNVADEFSAMYISLSPSKDGYNTESRTNSLSTIYSQGYWDIKRVSGSSNVVLSLGYNVRTNYILAMTHHIAG